MLYNSLKGLPSVLCCEGYFCLREKIPGFGATATIKLQRQLCRILGGVDLVVTWGMQLRRYNADGEDGGDWKRRIR